MTWSLRTRCFDVYIRSWDKNSKTFYSLLIYSLYSSLVYLVLIYFTSYVWHEGRPRKCLTPSLSVLARPLYPASHSFISLARYLTPFLLWQPAIITIHVCFTASLQIPKRSSPLLSWPYITPNNTLPLPEISELGPVCKLGVDLLRNVQSKLSPPFSLRKPHQPLSKLHWTTSTERRIVVKLFTRVKLTTLVLYYDFISLISYSWFYNHNVFMTKKTF